jgi:hypothetical protein
MPIIDIEENIKKIRVNIEQMTQELFRLQGMLQTFEGFKRGGLKTIDMPNDPNDIGNENTEVQELINEIKENA